MESIHHLAVGIGPRRVTGRLADETKLAVGRVVGARPAGSPGGPQTRFTNDAGFVQPADVATVMAVLDLVARTDDLIAALWLDLPRRVELELSHALKRARGAPNGFALIAPGRRARATIAIEALLELHMASLRTRTPAQRAALGAQASHPTLTEAAASLGCSRQAVSQAIVRSNKITTDLTRPALLAILDLASVEDRTSDNGHPTPQPHCIAFTRPQTPDRNP
jgi:hypothetical protein